MYVFTLWNQTVMPEGYAQCITALRTVYPSLVVERFECPDGHRPDQFSDFIRLQRMAEIRNEALYVDADCIPHEPFTGGDRPAFANLRGGVLDIWAMYKPIGYNQVFALALRRWRPYGHIQSYVNATRDQYDTIGGYPDNRYFSHRHLSGLRAKEKTNNE